MLVMVQRQQIAIRQSSHPFDKGVKTNNSYLRFYMRHSVEVFNTMCELPSILTIISVLKEGPVEVRILNYK